MYLIISHRGSDIYSIVKISSDGICGVAAHSMHLHCHEQ